MVDDDSTHSGDPNAVPDSGDPPFGKSSGGKGGPRSGAGSATAKVDDIEFHLIVPQGYDEAKPTPLLVVYSGVEGAKAMTNNLRQVGDLTNTGDFIRVILDGVVYNANGKAGATILDAMRKQYNIDNDRTYLLGESAGTTAAFELGFDLKQSYFAAYWANDVNAIDGPKKSADELLFAPWGQVGPGSYKGAPQIVQKMKAKGYRLPDPAPYNGPGANTHGDTNQFFAALKFFAGKTRK